MFNLHGASGQTFGKSMTAVTEANAVTTSGNLHKWFRYSGVLS